jgi:hypothetical protein
VFAFANVMDFFPDELTRLCARCLAGALVSTRPLQRHLLGHDDSSESIDRRDRDASVSLSVFTTRRLPFAETAWHG